MTISTALSPEGEGSEIDAVWGFWSLMCDLREKQAGSYIPPGSFARNHSALTSVLKQVNGEGDENERGRTQSIAGTLQPVWRNPPEVFILTAVEELILEVRTDTMSMFTFEPSVAFSSRAFGRLETVTS